MTVNDRLVRLLVGRADRLSVIPDIDSVHIDEIGPVPPRTPPVAPSAPISPWDAARAQLCSHGTIDTSPAGEQLLVALLDNPHATPDELHALLRRPGLSDAQRHRILQHPNTPGELVLAHICDNRHDTSLITADVIRSQVAMLLGASGLTSEQRLAAWATLTLRSARGDTTRDLVGDVLVASPNASTILHAAIARAATTTEVPPGLRPHLLSHLAAPATIALLTLPCLFRLIDADGDSHVSTDRLIDTVVDMVAAACGPDPARWARMFKLAANWDRSIATLLDLVQTDTAPVTVLRHRRATPGHMRDTRTPPLRSTPSTIQPVAPTTPDGPAPIIAPHHSGIRSNG